MLPALELDAAGQLVHSDTALPPVSTRYVPPGHAVHEIEAHVSLYSPAGHGLHPEEPEPSNPALHLQSLSFDAPARDVESDGHAVHPPDPVASLYVPASHSLHTVAFAPVYPTSHTQSRYSLLPTADTELAGQLVQTADVSAATEIEYVSALHDVHDKVPITVLYVPATHAGQSRPSGPE